MATAVKEPDADREKVSLEPLTEADLREFANPKFYFASRRWAAEACGMFFLMLIVYGSGMIGDKDPGTISTGMVAAAIGLLLMGLVFAFGKISGAHFNPMVTLAYALRGALPWRRVAGYWIAQLVGATIALLVTHFVIGGAWTIAVAAPSSNVTAVGVMFWEAVLTFGLITILLSVVNGAMNVGQMSAFALSGYFSVVILMFAQYEGVAMNPTRAIVPAIFANDYTDLWAYVVGPTIGVFCAIGFAFFLRGRGAVGLEKTLTSVQGDVEGILPDKKDNH